MPENSLTLAERAYIYFCLGAGIENLTPEHRQELTRILAKYLKQQEA